MESAAALRSFNCSVGTVSRVRSIHNRPSMVAVHNVSWPTLSKSHIQGFALGGKLVSYPAKREEVVVSCATTSETTVATDSDVLSDKRPQGLLEKNSLRGATFPNGFEALVLQVCDETEVAELKLKVGSFRKGRTVKGRKLPPACFEGHVIKEGQVIGFLDQFGKELPVRSDVAGEVLKVFFDEGDAVGYGDPLIAVLPSFPGIN